MYQGPEGQRWAATKIQATYRMFKSYREYRFMISMNCEIYLLKLFQQMIEFKYKKKSMQIILSKLGKFEVLFRD